MMSRTMSHFDPHPRPMFFAALGQVYPGVESGEQDGFVIITVDSDQGMVDIHDRRPVVLNAEHAREWIDPYTQLFALRSWPEIAVWMSRISYGIHLASRLATCEVKGRS
ncbi:hypothetical protein A7J50_6001 (plasmid) [Pseudomonas antarctica]|uniref:Abasic site processing protein n=1 Tax=Pseudomonas antarctica TaxID=219572 RepID=A0A172Z9X5_9PSED|nr:hypothetical protein A7J50_6001 [Pseudomonas antarctica]